MIAVQGRRTSFAAVAAYLVNGRTGKEQDRVAWSAVRNLPTNDPELVVAFMEATAAQSWRVEKPAYHFSVSFAPEDKVDRAVMERVVDRVLERLGLTEHHALLVAHRDRPNRHVHVMVCLVHPETGRSWVPWHDWPRARQALRMAERALGLREVQAELSREQATRARVIEHDRGRTRLPDVQPAARGEPKARPSAVAALVGDIRLYERLVERIREQYQAQVDASGARARITGLELAAERSAAARAAAERGLERVYRDPARAFAAYRGAVDESGVAKATHLMRAEPERFGRLATAERHRALGLIRTEDARPARAAVPAAATAARQAIEADRAYGALAAELALRRSEQAFTRELEMTYLDPNGARSAFDRLAERAGRAICATIRERPAALGAVHPSVSGDGTRLNEQTGQVVAKATELLAARESVAMAKTTPSEGLLERERALAQAETDRATARDAMLGAELRALPDRAMLERRIRYALSRLSPDGLRRLEQILEAPQLALARQLRKVGRDLALGRAEEREPSVSVERG